MKKILLKVGIVFLPLGILLIVGLSAFTIQGQLRHGLVIAEEPDGLKYAVDIPYWINYLIPWTSLLSLPITTFYSIKLWQKYVK